MAQPFDKKLSAIEGRNSRRQPQNSPEPTKIEKTMPTKREPGEEQEPMNRRPIPGGTPSIARTNEVKDDELRDVLEEALEKMVELQTIIDNQVERLTSLHFTDQYRLPDDKIARSVNELRQDIRDWSRHFQSFPQKNALAYILPDQECPFSKVSYKSQEYLDQDAFGPQLLVQSYVWKFLCEKVFGKLLWAGESCEDAIRGTESLKTLNSLARKNGENGENELGLKNYHHWRAQTARLMEKHRRDHPKCIETSLKNIRKEIAQHIKSYSTSGSIFSDKNGSKGTLQTIVETAVTLDLHLWQQKAKFFFFEHWYPSLSQKELAFKNWMQTDRVVVSEETLQREETHVHLFCAPSLVKNGSTDGNDYMDRPVVICKAVMDILFHLEDEVRGKKRQDDLFPS